MSPSFIITQQYFVKYRVRVAYIVILGFSVGSLSGGPLMRYLIDTFAWRGALIIHAGIVLHSAVFSCAFFPLPEAKRKLDTDNESKDHTKRSLLHRLFFEFFDCALWLEVKYTLYCASCFTSIIATLSLVHHCVNYALFYGVDKHHAALLVTVGGSGSLSSRLIFGAISDHPKLNRPLQFALSQTLVSLFIFLLLLAHNLLGIAIISYAVGFCAGEL